MKPIVWIIVLNYNNSGDTSECLDSLVSLDYPDFRIIVVDNNSSTGSLAELKIKFPTVTIIENGRNLGFAEGNNVGLRCALAQRADYLFVLNNDTYLPADTLTRMVDLAERDAAIGMICPAVVSYYDHTKRYVPVIDWQNCMAGEWQLDPAETTCRDVDYAAGCAQLVKARVAREIGLYDPAYFLYYEDSDWSQRCKQAGYRVVIDPSSEIYHKGTPDRNEQKGSATLFYYFRNQWLFFSRYGKHLRRRSILARHTRNCLVSFRNAMQAGDEGKAVAVLEGWLASIFRVYGPRRLVAPMWLRRLMIPATWFVLKLYDNWGIS